MKVTSKEYVNWLLTMHRLSLKQLDDGDQELQMLRQKKLDAMKKKENGANHANP